MILKSKKALIVDDIPTNIMVLELALEEFGLTTRSASSGMLATTILEDQSFDISFIDFHMPEENGASFLLNCFESSIYDRLGRIYMVSADITLNPSRMHFDDYVEGFLTKPIELDEIENLL